MKQIFFGLLAGILFLITTNGIDAQSTAKHELLERGNNITASKKALTPVKDNIAGIDSISPKALKHFTHTYKNVTGESWEKIKDGFATTFIINDVMNTVYYNARGKWAGSLKQYREDKMSRNIRAIIKAEYYDYSINYVEELENIDSGGIPTYIIHLADKNSIKLIRIYSGQMDMLKEFNKS